MANIILLEKYIEEIDINSLTLEELEHYTKIVIALENKRLDDIQREEILKEIHSSSE